MERKHQCCSQQATEAKQPSKRLKVCSDGPEITDKEYQQAVTVLPLERRRPWKSRNHAVMKELTEKTRRERQRSIEQ